MRWLLVLALCACGRDQREACTKAARDAIVANEAGWIQRCVDERWSARKIDCMQRTGLGSFASMHCVD